MQADVEKTFSLSFNDLNTEIKISRSWLIIHVNNGSARESAKNKTF
jgi:hypothetical protein